MRPSRASDAEVDAALATLPGWQRIDDAIVTSFELSSFADAIAFVVRVGFFAEAHDHHPDLDIRYRTVHVSLSTHDAGGLTELDFEMAQRIDDILMPPEGT